MPDAVLCPQEVIRDWQQAASSVLVAVGQRFINKVMEEVLTKFQPGILPHYFIVQTFANLSVSNGELSSRGSLPGGAAGGDGGFGLCNPHRVPNGSQTGSQMWC